MSARAAFVVFAALVALVVHAQTLTGPELPQGDWTEIRRVVVAQREAMLAGDAAAAHAHAAPGIRAMYPTPSTFMAMVQRAYAPLLDARSAELLDGAVIGGDVVQPLRLTMPDGTVLVALYTMHRMREGWRIAGCVIAPSTLRSA